MWNNNDSLGIIDILGIPEILNHQFNNLNNTK
jgi:hypothetical protein